MSTTPAPNWQEIANEVRRALAKEQKQHIATAKKLYITERENARLDFALRTLEAKCNQQKT